MISRVAVIRARNPWLAALLLVTFFARALIPAGFMPGPGGLILCHGFTPASHTASQAMDHDMSSMDMSGMAHHGGHPSHDGGGQNHESSSLCPFAAAATTMATGHSAVFTLSAAVETGSIQLPDPPFVPRGTIVPTRLPRGPPAFA
jgi:hypothetical protein